jgi:nucleotide-binding universal stress UspA family protein
MTKAIRRILVAVDPANGREPAFEYALALARRRNAELYLFHAHPDRRPASRLAATGARLELRDRALSQLTALVRSAESEGMRVHVLIARGDDRVRAITAHAYLVDADLIVIARDYGRSWIRRRASVARAVGRAAHVPVLIVPAGSRRTSPHAVTPFTRIVVAVDFTVASAVALRSAADLVAQADGHGTAVHALLPASPMVFSGGEAYGAILDWRGRTEAAEARLRRVLPAAARGRLTPRAVAGDAGQAILDVATETYADLVVMGVPSRNALDHLFGRSTFDTVVRRSRRPVLAIPVPAGGYPWVGDPDGIAVSRWHQTAA